MLLCMHEGLRHDCYACGKVPRHDDVTSFSQNAASVSLCLCSDHNKRTCLTSGGYLQKHHGTDLSLTMPFKCQLHCRGACSQAHVGDTGGPHGHGTAAFVAA